MERFAKAFLLVILTLSLMTGMVWGASATVTLRPAYIDISSTTSESAVLMTLSAYSSDDARYRLYNGSYQYNCWDEPLDAYITSNSYSSGPQVLGTPTTSTTFWIPFQRGGNNSVAASYRDRVNPYSTNYQTVALPSATAIASPVNITQDDVTFSTWADYSVKYIILAYDALSEGTLISATSSALSTGDFTLVTPAGTTIYRIEVRSTLNSLIESVTGEWPEATPPIITVNPTSRTAFSYIVESGPSAEQSFTVSGSDLADDITVTPPADYEISTGTGVGFSAANPITLTQSGGTVDETTIYVRLKAGLSAGVYNSEDITASSTDASNQTVTCSGWVSYAPMSGSDFVEDFTNSNADATYAERNFTGNNGIEWYYVESRDENNDANNSGINGNALMLRRASSLSKVYSGTVSGGIGNFYVRLYKGFTGVGTRQVELFINGVSKGTSEGFDDYDEHVFTVNGINIIGDVVIELRNTTEFQIIVDDISWTTYDAPLPITLAAFTADYVGGTVKLAWETFSETENAAFRIYRDGEMIAEIEGAGTTTEPHSYAYTDQYVIPGRTYSYQLADVSFDGEETKHNEVEVKVEIEYVDRDYSIGAAYPNPFNPLTIVPLNLAKDANVHAQLYDMLGRPVRELHKGNMSAGSHALRIDGSNLSTGIYFVHINVNNATHVQKIALMK